MSAQSQHHVLKNCVGNLCCALEGSRGYYLSCECRERKQRKRIKKKYKTVVLKVCYLLVYIMTSIGFTHNLFQRGSSKKVTPSFHHDQPLTFFFLDF